MFAGIVEEVGYVRQVRRTAGGAVFAIAAHKVLEGTQVGDSICVAGVCLTVTRLAADAFEADAMRETLERTTLGSIAAGAKVNLERALQLDSRLGGHIVSGHVDGTAKVAAIECQAGGPGFETRTIRFDCTPSIAFQTVEKGSIAIDGVSLTVMEAGDSQFSVGVIPHTLESTTLRELRAGTAVNVECDIIGKYVRRLAEAEAADANAAEADAAGARNEPSNRSLMELLT